MRRFNLILPIGLSLFVHIGVFVFAAAYYGAGPGGGGGGGNGGYPSLVTVSIVSLPGPGTGWDGREAAKTNIPARGIKKSLARKAVKRPQDKGKKVRREKFAGSNIEKTPHLENEKLLQAAHTPVIEAGESVLTRIEKVKAVRAAGTEISGKDAKSPEGEGGRESPQEGGPAENSMTAGRVPVVVSTGGGAVGTHGGQGPGLTGGGNGNPAAGGGAGPGDSIKIIGLNAPGYPRYSRIQGEEGTVIIEINLSGDGSPGRVVVARSSGYARLDRAALRAAREAEFIIPDGDKRRVMVSKRIAFTFKLRDGDARQ